MYSGYVLVVRKSFKFKLYSSKKNKDLDRLINIASYIYNRCVVVHKRYYGIFHKHLSENALKLHLVKLKKLPKYSFWRELNAQAIQDIAERIERGYKLFFRSLKSSRQVRPPSFKKKSKYKSVTFKQNGYKLLESNKVKIGKRVFRYFKSRDIEGKVKTFTVKRDTLGDFYICFSCEVEEARPDRAMTGKSAGFDFGLKTFLTSSDGYKIEAPLPYRRDLEKIRKLHKQLSGKQRGSNNRQRARLNLARLHRKVTNQRRDFHFKLARQLAETYDCIFLEDLCLEGMKRLWGCKVSDLGFSEFVAILEYMCKKLGSTLTFVDRFYPSTKTCSSCGSKSDLSLNDRQWVCSSCGTLHDRDTNAAINIYREGASSLGLDGIRPDSSGVCCLNPEFQAA